MRNLTFTLLGVVLASAPVAALSATAAPIVVAQSTAPPVAGANSFTEGQARDRIVKAGYTDVSALTKDSQGIWRGTAKKNGKSVKVSVDFKGNVTEG